MHLIILPQTSREERTKTVLQEWNRQKSSEKADKQKQLKQQAKEKHLEDGSEGERRKAESEVVYIQWKKKTEQMMREHRQRKREEERKRQEKEAEVEDRLENSKKVTEIWWVASQKLISITVHYIFQESTQR